MRLLRVAAFAVWSTPLLNTQNVCPAECPDVVMEGRPWRWLAARETLAGAGSPCAPLKPVPCRAAHTATKRQPAPATTAEPKRGPVPFLPEGGQEPMPEVWALSIDGRKRTMIAVSISTRARAKLMR